MELKQLKYFIAVIESGSLGKAAKSRYWNVCIKSANFKIRKRAFYSPLQRTALGTVPTPAGLAFSTGSTGT